jgi:hypothetical protein
MNSFSKRALKAVKAMALIPLASLLLSETASACQLGSTQSANGARVTVTTPRRTTGEYWASGTYTAPPGWAILNFNYRFINEDARRAHTERPNHFAWRWVSQGANYASYGAINSAYSRAIDTAARVGNYNLVANLREEASQALAVASSVYSDRGAVEIVIMKEAAGRFRGTRTVTVVPQVELLCVGTPFQFQERINRQIQSIR